MRRGSIKFVTVSYGKGPNIDHLKVIECPKVSLVGFWLMYIFGSREELLTSGLSTFNCMRFHG